MHSHRRNGLALLGVALALASAPCLASLGGAPSQFGNTSTNTSTRRAGVLAAGAPAAASAAYDINVTQLDNGTSVREYVAGGVVFAVAWNGPFLPNLRDLLGRHFATLTDATARQPKGGHGPVRIAQPDVTIESTGHMRAYSGRAWVGSLLPAGFNIDAIQ